MITLKDSIEIKTTPEKIFDWFKNLNKHFTKWSPCHKKFVKLTGGMDVGDIVYYEQCCEGEWYRVKNKITKIEQREQGWEIDYECLFPYSLLGIKGAFVGEKKGEACNFIAIEYFGFKVPVIGTLIDYLMKLFNPLIRFDIIERDMAEDGKRLKEILERS